MHSKINTVVFDFDGTLATLTLDFGLMKRKLGALAACYLDETPAANGQPALEWLEELTAEISGRLDHDTGREFNTRSRFLIMDMELAAAREGRLFPFTRGILSGLRERGLKTAVITRNCTPAVTAVFPDIRDCCDCFLAREDVARPKPEPEHIREALCRIRALPGETLMVGDHMLDILTGRRAGTRTAAVCTGRVSRQELEQAGPDFVAEDCAALFARLEAERLL